MLTWLEAMNPGPACDGAARRSSDTASAVTLQLLGFCLEFIVRNPVTATATAVPILRNGAVLAAVVLVLAFEIIRMTAGAIRLERGIRPVNGFGIVLVATCAREVAAMIQRFVR